MPDTDIAQLAQELTAHKQYCEERFVEGQQKMEHLTTSIDKNTLVMADMVSQTEGMIKVYNDISGAVRIGVTIQKLGFWVIKWPIIGAGLYAIWKWVSVNIIGVSS